MMKIRHFVFLATLSVLTACNTPQTKVTTYYDEFSGSTDMLADNELPSPAQPREVVWLDAFRLVRDGKRVYYFEARYLATAEVGWLEIEPGVSLIVTADGQTFRFVTASGSLNSRELVRKKSFAAEKALYEVSKEQLFKIAQAKQVKVQIKGTKGLVERDFGPRNLQDFRSFVSRYVM
jgi:hypothetical protein